MIKYNPLGTTFKEGNVTLVVALSTDDGRTCSGCWYNGKHKDDRNKRNYTKNCFKHGHACTSFNRKDGKQVIFREVK